MDLEVKRFLWGVFLLACVGIHIALTVGVIAYVVRVLAMFTKAIPPDPSLGLNDTLRALAMAAGALALGGELPSAMAAYVGLTHEP